MKGASAVAALSSEQLLAYLKEIYDIDDSVLAWLKAKKSTETCSWGAVRRSWVVSVDEVEEWHVDSLERCYQKLAGAAAEEAKRQQALVEARQAVANAARRQKQEEEDRRQAEARRELDRIDAEQRESH